jgi:NADPH:quinone reductase-like Zn-dependent oxidoreductase
MTTLPKTMRAVLMTGNGGFDKLVYRTDVPLPQLSAGEVLIRVGAAGVNNTDINTRIAWYSKSVTEGTTTDGGSTGLAAASSADSGWTGSAPHFPRIQGADACGRIVAVGPGVDPARIGERVLIEPVFRAPSLDMRGLDMSPDTPSTDTPAEKQDYRAIYFGSECDGAFADYAKAPAVHAHRIHSKLSDAELASFPCAYSAAENMLTKAKVAEGEMVLVTGASGGVGSAAVQLAKRRGARVIAVAGADKAAEIEALGAEQVMPRDADLVATLGRESLDVVIDVVGGDQFPQVLEVLKRGGRYAVAGAIAGPIVELDLRTLYLKDLRLLGCTILEPGVFANLVGYIARREIRPLVARQYALEDIVAAQEEFLRKRHVGKIVLLPEA